MQHSCVSMSMSLHKSVLYILLSSHIKVKYIFILASASKTLFIIAQ